MRHGRHEPPGEVTMDKKPETRQQLMAEIDRLRRENAGLRESLQQCREECDRLHTGEQERLLQQLRQANEELVASSARSLELADGARAASKRLQDFEYATEPALSELSLDGMLNELLRRLRQVLVTDTATILLLREGSDQLEVTTSSGLEEEVEQQVHTRLGRGVAGRIAAIRKPLAVEDLSQVEVLSPLLRRKVRSLLGAPLVVEGRLIGVIHVGTERPRRFDEGDLQLMELVARRAASAIARRRAEGARERLLAELDAILASLPDPVLVLDADGRVVRGNPAVVRLSGLDPVGAGSERLARKLKLRHPDGRPVSPEELPSARALRAERVVEERLLLTNAEGQEMIIEATAGPFFVEGRLQGAVSMFHDISDRERLLKEVEAERELLQAVLHQMPSGVAIVEAPSGKTLLTNRQLLNLWRHPGVLNEFEEYRALVGLFPDGRRYGTEDWPLVRSARTGEVVTNEEVRFQRSDGSWGTQIISSSPIRDREGRIVAGVVVSTDISERKESEAERERLLAEVQRWAAEMNATIGSIPDAVIIYDMEGTVRRVNAAARRLLGIKEESGAEAYSERMRQLRLETPEGQVLPVEDTPSWRVLHGETVHGFVTVVRNHGDRIRWASVSAAPIRTEAGDVLGAVCIYTDITEVHQLQEQLEDLVRMVSHDLRSPLTSVHGQAQILLRLLERSGQDGQMRKSAEGIVTGAKRMNVMIQDLVDMARAQSRQLHVQRARVKLPSFVHDLLQRVSDGLDTGRVRVEMPEELPEVWADLDRLERVLVNLLTNGLKYSEAEVLVTAASVDGEIRVSVRDRGPGIPPEELPRLFQRYYRARGAPRKAEGLGLGLYISRVLVEAMGGRIWAESEVGKGSCFCFTLPLASGGG